MMQVDVENGFNNIFQDVMIIELCEDKRPLSSIALIFRLFYGAHFSFYF